MAQFTHDTPTAFHNLPEDIQREIQRKGTERAKEVRAERKQINEIVRAVLEQQLTDVADYDYGAVPIDKATVLDVLIAVHANKGLKGDTQSAKLVLDAAKGESSKTSMLGGFKFVIEPGDNEI